MADITVTIRLPSECYDGLKFLAQEDDRSARNYIRRILIQHTEAKVTFTKPAPSRPALPKPAIDLTMKHCRKCSGSIPAQEYDDYGGYCVQHGKKTA